METIFYILYITSHLTSVFQLSKRPEQYEDLYPILNNHYEKPHGIFYRTNTTIGNSSFINNALLIISVLL